MDSTRFVILLSALFGGDASSPAHLGFRAVEGAILFTALVKEAKAQHALFDLRISREVPIGHRLRLRRLGGPNHHP